MSKSNGNGQPRIGVYVCVCGTNIAAKVQVPEVVKHASTLPNVITAREYQYMCADPGQTLIKNDIKEYNLNRIVVASCSPHLHEETFRKATLDGGQNPYLFHMANIREHSSWVTENSDEATTKAKAIVSGAVYRVAFHKELMPKSVKVDPNVLVIGGGIAGITAALTIANSGKKVYLVEKDSSLGGHMAKFDKTFPTLDCASCILTPKMTSVKDHPNIEVITFAEVDSVDGFVGNFKVKVKKRPRYVIESECIGCHACVDQCVYKTPKFRSEFEEGVGLRKPVYIPFPQAVPNYAVIDPETCIEFKSGHCKKTCVTACNEVAGRDAIDFNQQDEFIDIEVGAIIVSTGFQIFNAERTPEYGFGKYDNVFNSLEIERLVNSSGPTGGELLLRDGKTRPESVAIVHCVGSRDKNNNKWCSKVCCMYSLKLAHLIRDRTGAEVFNFYIDMRTPGKGYEEFYEKLLDEGVHFIRGKVSEVTDWPIIPEEEGKLIIRAEDTLVGAVRRIPVDMVVLAVGMEPKKDAPELRKKVNMSCSQEGWFLERHPKLAPVNTFTNGVFIAGACQGPKDIPETVAQAQAAAAEAMSLIDKGVQEMEPNVASINAEKCSGCHVCLAMCPYTAISFDEKDKVAVINEAVCKGCGTCVGACPSKAIKQNLFQDEQIFAEIEGLLLV